jgi:hypothetical protein
MALVTAALYSDLSLVYHFFSGLYTSLPRPFSPLLSTSHKSTLRFTLQKKKNLTERLQPPPIITVASPLKKKAQYTIKNTPNPSYFSYRLFFLIPSRYLNNRDKAEDSYFFSVGKRAKAQPKTGSGPVKRTSHSGLRPQKAPDSRRTDGRIHKSVHKTETTKNASYMARTLSSVHIRGTFVVTT